MARVASVVVPANLRSAAKRRDDLLGKELSALAPLPHRPYKPAVIKDLGHAIARVLGAFGMAYTPDVSGSAQGALPPEMARFLVMIMRAAEAYGKPLSLSLDRLRSDNDLVRTAADLLELAQDKGFKDFLAGEEEEEAIGLADEEMAEEGAEMEEEAGEEMAEEDYASEEAEAEAEEGLAEEDEEEDMFANRVRTRMAR